MIAKDLVLFFISCAAFIMSTLTWICTFVYQRKNISFEILECRNNSTQLLIYLAIVNKSRLPVSITSIAIVKDELIIPCVKFPKAVMTEKHTIAGKLIDLKNTYTMTMPISLSPLAGTSGFCYFEFSQAADLTNAKDLTFQVCTNRGKAVQMTLPLPQEQDTIV